MKKHKKWTLVADSGSTKTDWRFLTDGETVAAQTAGINPVYQSPEEITDAIRSGLGDVPEAVGAIYFYGAGCLPVTKRAVETALRKVWRWAEVEVESDLLGAARGLCGDGRGIVSILGTGSNSCYYNGFQIVHNTPPMGFILGDEGSGAHLGKLLINGIFKNQLPREIADDLFEEYRLDRNLIIEAVYRKPFPNRFLAQFARYIRVHIENPYLEQLVKGAFAEFLEKNLAGYPDVEQVELAFTGSVAYHFAAQLQEAVFEKGWHSGLIVDTPIDGLVAYHLTHDND